MPSSKNARVRRGPKTAAVYASDLEYIEQELEWIAARAGRMEAERVQELPDDEQPTPWARPKLSPASAKARATKLRRVERRLRREVDARLAATRAAGRRLALDELCASHRLDAFDRTVLLLAAGPCFGHRFGRLYGALDPHERSQGLTVEVTFAFCELGFAERAERRLTFGHNGRLGRADLLSLGFGDVPSPADLLSSSIELTTRAFGFMLGRSELSADLVDFSAVETPRAGFDQVVIAPEDKARILSVVEHHARYVECRAAWGFDDVISYGRGVLMLFHGRPGTGKTMMAHGVAQRVGKRVLTVDIPTFAASHQRGQFLPALFREARLQDAILFFDECETLLASRRSGNALMNVLLTELERYEGIAIFATNLPETLDEALERRLLVRVRFPEPDAAARREIWASHLPATAPIAADVDLDALAQRYDVSGGLIKNAVLMAVAEAVHTQSSDEHAGEPAITMAMLERALRAQTAHVFDASPEVSNPKARLADLVLPSRLRQQVDEVVSAARGRRTVLEGWGVGQHFDWGKGVSALLSGPPGTGKTLCAHAMAGELVRPLVVASVPGLVSKWVGETEKNLAALFERARSNNAVLFFDEADSLLTARGAGSASRHDDSAVNVLLGLLERHDGLVILATNLGDRLDPALERRLTYILPFERPNAAQRTAIWRSLLPASVPVDGPLDLEALGRAFPLSGGLIKNAVLKAAFRAASRGRLTMSDLTEAAREVHNGRVVSERRAGFRAEGAA